LTPREIAVLAAASPSVTVAVAGDLMLDETWIGASSASLRRRPVPLLALTSMSRRAGGAGNVVENLAALGARALTLGAVGPGEEGAWLARRLTSLAGASGTVVVDPRRTTPVKRRMVSEGRQMLRVDEEVPAGLSAAAEAALVAAARTSVAAADVLLVSDYAKGTLTPAVMAALFEAARAKGIPALVDPKGKDYSRYRGATVVTPNRKELETVTGATARDLPAVARLGAKLRDELGLEALLVKLSEEGVLLLARGKEPLRIVGPGARGVRRDGRGRHRARHARPRPRLRARPRRRGGGREPRRGLRRRARRDRARPLGRPPREASSRRRTRRCSHARTSRRSRPSSGARTSESSSRTAASTSCTRAT
jgi:D-beta-D-heptose 7-phosphate kinase/D-beta-D-heptose 1-phosphate adenosyltransferase